LLDCFIASLFDCLIAPLLHCHLDVIRVSYDDAVASFTEENTMDLSKKNPSYLHQKHQHPGWRLQRRHFTAEQLAANASLARFAIHNSGSPVDTATGVLLLMILGPFIVV
jgi:hypothetical protein